jgi:hypothetical protein
LCTYKRSSNFLNGTTTNISYQHTNVNTIPLRRMFQLPHNLRDNNTYKTDRFVPIFWTSSICRNLPLNLVGKASILIGPLSTKQLALRSCEHHARIELLRQSFSVRHFEHSRMATKIVFIKAKRDVSFGQSQQNVQS